MLSHLLVHLPPLPLRSQIALFSMPRHISGTNFHFHLFMPISNHHSLYHLPPSITSLPRLVGPMLTGLVRGFSCGRLNWVSSFSAHAQISNFIIIIIIIISCRPSEKLCVFVLVFVTVCLSLLLCVCMLSIRPV